MSVLSINSSIQTFGEIFGNGRTYRVPLFQRDYSWGQSEWSDLWEDIERTGSGDPDDATHYMGYIVLREAAAKQFEIVDGQQRLATLSLLLLAGIKHLERLSKLGSEAAKTRAELFRTGYIGALDPVTLNTRPKLTLNRNDQHFFETYIVPLRSMPRSKLKRSEKSLRDSFEYFYKKIEPLTIGDADGEAIARLVERIAEGMVFTVITVTKELNAFRVFETLNARGVRLSPTDLLKNFLFAEVHRELPHTNEIDQLQARWEKILGRLGESSFTEFLRVHWSAHHKSVPESELFKEIAKSITGAKRVFELVRALEDDVQIFAELGDPTSDYWDANQLELAKTLRLLRVDRPRSLLLAARAALDDGEFTKVLRAVVMLAFRLHVIIGRSTGEEDRQYGNIARRIGKAPPGGLNSASEIIGAMRTLYPLDDEFRAAFEEKRLSTHNQRNAKVAKYILFEIERHTTQRDYDRESKTYTLEHILPETPGDGWPEVAPDDLDDLTFRLGNFALLEAKPNRQIGNEPFETKRIVYAESTFKLTNDLAESYASWGRDEIAQRQRALARTATAVWRISQLDPRPER